MDFLVYQLVRCIIGLIQTLPLDWVARIGRCLGGMVYTIDARHRRVAIKNLTACFGTEKSPEEIRGIARENFKRIGENFAAATKTVALTSDQLHARFELVGAGKLIAHASNRQPSSIILAIGHFGNFELFAQLDRDMPLHQRATTYRAMKPDAVNRLMLQMRNSTGCLYFERRSQGTEMRAALRTNKIILGLLSDQHSGDHGLRLPFLGRECTTTKAPAVLAMRFDAPLHPAICYRTGLARWRIEMGDEIPTRENGQPRAIEEIMLDVNRAFEVAVRRDPANWFWVHNRWKQPKPKISTNIAVADGHEPESSGDSGPAPENQQGLSGQH